jgi:hypothetical protein
MDVYNASKKPVVQEIYTNNRKYASQKQIKCSTENIKKEYYIPS